jgi:predicted small lipoprotein YifL
MMTMRNAINKFCGLIVFLVMTTGCGQKGPLFLPGDPATVQSDVPGQYQSEPSSEDEDDADADDEDDQ